MLFEFEAAHVSGVDPLRLAHLKKDFARSNLNAKNIKAKLKDGPVTLSCPVVHSLGNNFAGTSQTVRGSKNYGRIVFEFPLNLEALESAKKYDALTVASKWNQEFLQAHCSTPVYLNHEAASA